MTDDDLIERLERYAGYLDGTTPVGMTPDRISGCVATELKAIARRLRLGGLDKIPRLISELASRGAGFPPSNGIN